MKSFKFIGSLALAMALCGANAHATVVESLPYIGTPDWATAGFEPATINYTGTETTITTHSGGVYFGTYYPSSSAAGNELSLTARFSDGSRDWNTYLADGNYFAGMLFGPTGCNGNVDDCYFAPYTEGVQLSFATALNSGVANDLFIDLDMQEDNEFGFLLKDGLVSYLVNGQTYSGYAQNGGYNILVIGDGSGSTRTGSGSMTISAVRYDNAPAANVVLGTVPEPATWATMIGGFALIGASARRSRKIAARSRAA